MHNVWRTYVYSIPCAVESERMSRRLDQKSREGRWEKLQEIWANADDTVLVYESLYTASLRRICRTTVNSSRTWDVDISGHRIYTCAVPRTQSQISDRSFTAAGPHAAVEHSSGRTQRAVRRIWTFKRLLKRCFYSFEAAARCEFLYKLRRLSYFTYLPAYQFLAFSQGHTCACSPFESKK